MALAARGLLRTTQDLDLIVEASAQQDLIRFLETRGYRTLHRSSGYSNHSHPDPAWGRVDFVYIQGETSERLFSSCSRLLGPGDIEIPVPRPEHLAALKVVALKNDPSRELQDLADIRYLLNLPGLTGSRSGATLRGTAWRAASMRSKEPSDLLDFERDIPTTAEDIRALKEHRPRAGEDWLHQLEELSRQFPVSPEELARRRTFEGCEPFEL